MDYERLTSPQAAHLIGVHDVLIAGALAAETGVVEDMGLLSALHFPSRAGEGGRFVRLLELVEDHGSDGAGQSTADRLVRPKTRPRLAQ